jgi:hypothetical protein
MGNDDANARGVGRGLGDEYGDDRGEERDREQAREPQGVGDGGAHGLGEAGLGEERAQHDAGAEDRMVPQSIPAASFQLRVKRRSDQSIGRKKRSVAALGEPALPSVRRLVRDRDAA